MDDATNLAQSAKQRLRIIFVSENHYGVEYFKKLVFLSILFVQNLKKMTLTSLRKNFQTRRPYVPYSVTKRTQTRREHYYITNLKVFKIKSFVKGKGKKKKNGNLQIKINGHETVAYET